MKILTLHRLLCYVATYHFVSTLAVLLVLELSGVSGRTDVKTKLLLQNIRTHLAQKADEIVKKKECESGLILCKNPKEKEPEGEEEKSEEIPPPPKLVRGQHKPIIKVSSKDVVQTFMPKAHKSLFRKLPKPGENEKPKNMFHSLEDSDESKEQDISDEPTPKKDKPDKPTPEKEKSEKPKLEKDKTHKPPPPKEDPEGKKPLKVQKPPKSDQVRESGDEKQPKKIMKTDFKDDMKVSKKKIKEEPKKEKIEKTTEKGKKTVTEKKKEVSVSTAEENPMLLPGAYVFVVDSDGEQNTLCKKHSQIYLKQLKKYQIWALMMYDASAKLTSGVLQGNVNLYGDFDECLAINAVFKNLKERSKNPSGIKGKYCLATIDITTDSESKNLAIALERVESFQFIKSTIHDPGHFIPRFSTVNWGMCIPSACTAEDVERFLKSRLEPYTNTTGLEFDVDVDESNCVVKDDLKFESQTETMTVIFFYLAVFCVSLYATYLDKKKQGQTEPRRKEAVENEGDGQLSLTERMKKIVQAFSLRKNTEKLLTDENRGAIECINGIKSIFTLMLYFAHKTIPLGMTPFSNRVFLTKISNQPTTILLRASLIYTDSFLLISGVLTSYNIAKEISEKKKVSWMKKAAARFIRLTPALLAVLLFYAYVWDRLGSGPVWNLVVGKNSQLCRKFMWRNLLYIQNLFQFEDMCAPQTHQLALDMQLSLLAPLFVHIMHTHDKVGVGILQALFILSSIMRYMAASNNDLSVVIYHGMPVSQLYKTANLLYGQTIHRASPYLLGSIVGFYLKKMERDFEMPKAFAALGWILSFTFGFYSVVSPSPAASRSYRYDTQEAAQYAALSPVAWSLALSWLIIACHLGYGGFLNDFLCRKVFLVLSRISYSVYLTQFLVFFYKVGVTRIPELFTITGSLDVTEFLTVIGISVVVTLFFDLPMMEVKKIILDKMGTKKQSQEGLQVHPDEQSKESELEEEEGRETISREDSQETTEELPDELIEEEGEYEEEDIEGADIEEEGAEGEGIEEEGAEGEGIEEEGAEGESIEEEDIEGDGNEEEDADEADVEEDRGELEEKSDEEAKDEVAEVFVIRPLRRSTRMHFSEDSEEKQVFQEKPEIDENEQK